MLTDNDLAAWIAGLDDLFALVAGRFHRVEPRKRARAYVRGLLAPLAAKNGWTLAEAAGDPAGWVTADEAYGKDHKFRAWLEARRVGYVVAVPSSQAVPGSAGTSRADALAAHAPRQAWKRRNCGDGAKGPRIFDWAVASLPGDEDGAPPGWSRHLLVRRAVMRNGKGEHELAYYLCCAPAGATDDELIRV